MKKNKIPDAIKKYVTEPTKLIFLGFFTLYYGIGLTGYGIDDDTYLMIKTGQELLLNGKYFPSRPPGYFIPEIVIGATSIIGGFYLTNLISAILGTCTLYLFWKIINNILKPFESILLVTIIGINPYFIIASSSSIDYNYSLFFIFLGITLFIRGKYFIAALPFTLAVSSRISSIVIIFSFYVYYLISNKETDKQKVYLSLLITLFFSSIFFLPSFLAFNNSFGFLTYYIGDWSFFGHLSRFIYKNIYLLGLSGTIVLYSTLFYYLVRKRKIIFKSKELLFCMVLILLIQLSFFKLPIEISYLLPVLFLLIPIWYYLINKKSKLILAWTVLVLCFFFNFINIDILEIDHPGLEAVDAKIAIKLRKGVLLEDINNRDSAQKRFYKYFEIKY